MCGWRLFAIRAAWAGLASWLGRREGHRWGEEERARQPSWAFSERMFGREAVQYVETHQTAADKPVPSGGDSLLPFSVRCPHLPSPVCLCRSPLQD